jgi:hypothetical protein
MKPSRIAALLFTLFIIAFSCSKDSDGGADLFYGRWVNTNNTGDTLWFAKTSGKNTLTCFSSPGAMAGGIVTMLNYEYRYRNNKLYIKSSWSSEFSPVANFKWDIHGKEFRWNGNHRFLFLSSIQPDYVYRKLP